jgi:hypothetical protein
VTRMTPEWLSEVRSKVAEATKRDCEPWEALTAEFFEATLAEWVLGLLAEVDELGAQVEVMLRGEPAEVYGARVERDAARADLDAALAKERDALADRVAAARTERDKAYRDRVRAEALEEACGMVEMRMARGGESIAAQMIRREQEGIAEGLRSMAAACRGAT